MAIMSGMLTANPMENLTSLSCRSFSRAFLSISSLTSPESPKYRYPESSMAFLISSIPETEGL